MNSIRNLFVLVAALWLSGCATGQTFVKSPSISLTGVELSKIHFSRQTFLLSFNVRNPNAFPLPVKRIRYKIMLEDKRFAGGETQSDFVIPARGDSEFIISVDLDILQSGADLAAIIHSGVRGDIGYALDGSLTVDIPLTRPIDFSTTGTVMVQASPF